MSYNTKNYTEQGGEVTHIGGELIVEEGATVTGLPSSTPPIATTTEAGIVKVGNGLSVEDDGTLSATGITPAANQAASTASTVAGLVRDFNDLLLNLKNAGLMEEDPIEDNSSNEPSE